MAKSNSYAHSVFFFFCPDFVPGSWLKPEDTVPLKTKRADFAAAILGGRMIVAGGLGM